MVVEDQDVLTELVWCGVLQACVLELPGIVDAVVLSRGNPLPITRFGLGEGRGGE